MDEFKSDSSDDSSSDSSDSSDSDMDVYEDWDKVVNPKNLANADEAAAVGGIKVMTEDELKEDDLFAIDETSGGDVQFSAVRPYVGAIVAPSNAPKENKGKPDKDLHINWVYGYRAYDSRSNLVYNSKGEMIYPIAGVVVMYDVEEHSQRYYMGHTDDVICLAQQWKNPDVIATGQVATIFNKRAMKPHICVWNSVTGQEWILKNAAERAVRSVGFSVDGRYLASVGGDNNHTITVWDWEKKKKICEEKGDTNKIYHLKWNHQKPNEFVTVGEKHVYFWTFDNGTLKKKRGLLGKKGKNQLFCSVAFSDKGYACVGCKDGNIYVFVKNTMKKAFKVHKGNVYTIDWYPGGLISGGKDKTVAVMSKKVKVVNRIECGARVHSARVMGNKLLVGLANGSIKEVKNFVSNSDAGRNIVQGHYDGELWALATAPDSKTFATAGEDNMLCIWSFKTHHLLRSAPISKMKGKGKRIKRKKTRSASSTTKHPPYQCARAIDYHPSGKELAVGTNAGWIIVFDVDTLQPKLELDLNNYGKRKVKNQLENWIQTLHYSKDGSKLAVGTHGSVICLIDVHKDYAVKATLKAHHSAISFLDWSADGKHLRSNDIGYELLFHDVKKKLRKTKQQTSVKLLKDVEWHTHSCVLAWGVVGVFDPDQDGTDINAVDRSPDGKYLVSGDDYGDVCLWNYPVIEPGNDRHRKEGHSAHVMAVKFAENGKYVLSAGGNDKAIIQWKLR